MQKIPTIFQREDGGQVIDVVTPGTEWVFDGQGIPTRKYDGTACLLRDGKLYKRHDVKQGKDAPEGFEPAEERDPESRHWLGWVPVGDGPEDRYHREAHASAFDDGTYELCGPKVQGNPEGFYDHMLIRHGNIQYRLRDCSPAGLRNWLLGLDIEGIVWHHPDGRMAKIKKRDFGMGRKD